MELHFQSPIPSRPQPYPPCERDMAEPPEELWEEILLRLPHDDPATLLRASLVCQQWRRIFSRPAFLRRFGELHRAAPVLGFYHNYVDEDDETVGVAFAPTAAAAFSLLRPELHSWVVVDCRHGRLLLSSGEELVVWEPTTGYYRLVPDVPAEFQGHRNAAVVCAANGCDHLSCEGGPFRVVIVYNLDEEDEDEDYEWVDTCTLARVYSSETGAWGEATSLCAVFLFEDKPSMLAGDFLYFPFNPTGWIDAPVRILKYDLRRHNLDLIEVEEEIRFFDLVQMEDGGLGIAVVDDDLVLRLLSHTRVKCEDVWVQSKIIHLKDVLPPAAALLKFAGFAEGADTIFLATTDGVYTIELKTGRARKVCSRVNLNSPLFPFTSQVHMLKVRAYLPQSYSSLSSMLYHELEASSRHLQEQLDEHWRKHEVLCQGKDILESHMAFHNIMKNFGQTVSYFQQRLFFTSPNASPLPLAQQQEAQSGVQPIQIEPYIRGDLRTDPSSCSDKATEGLGSYEKMITDTNGPDYDQRRKEVDPVTLYNSGDTKEHGKISMFNGYLDTGIVLNEVSSSHASQSHGLSARETCLEELWQSQQSLWQQQEYFVAWQEQQQAVLQEHMSRLIGRTESLFPSQHPPLFGQQSSEMGSVAPTQDVNVEGDGATSSRALS